MTNSTKTAKTSNKLEHVIKASGGKNTRSSFSAPISMLAVDTKSDARAISGGRETTAYKAHFQELKAGIIGYGGIPDTVIVHRGKGDNDKTLFIIEGRTSYYAALEALKEGSLGTDDPDQLFVNVKVESGSESDQISTQFRQQNKLAFNFSQEAFLVKRQLRLCAGNVELAADKMLLDVKKVERFIEFDALPLQAKTLVDAGTVGLANALELAKDHTGDELIAVLDTATQIKAEKDADTSKGKGKGYKEGKVTKSDLYAAKLKAMPDSDRAKLLTEQKQTVIDALTLADFDPYILSQLVKKVETEIKRITK